jgi:hypothetical protein
MCDQPCKCNESSEALPDIGLFKAPAEAAKAVSTSYDYWSGNLTTSSLQMNYALIGANWIIFGSVNGILGSPWAKWSMLFVLFALVVNVLGSWILSEVLRNRIDYGEENYPRWSAEFEEARGKKSPWPFTSAIDNIGRGMRWVKASLTLASGMCLIVGALLKPVVQSVPTVVH